MAITANYTDKKTGLTIQGAYIKVENVIVDNLNSQINVFVFFDKKSRDEGLRSIARLSISNPATDNISSLSSAYDKLKTMTEIFSDIEDAL
jgi:hypothetical protein